MLRKGCSAARGSATQLLTYFFADDCNFTVSSRRLDEEPKRAGTLGPAWIEKKEAGNRCSVGLEHASETSRAELLVDQRLHDIGETQSLLSKWDREKAVVDDNAASHGNSPGAAASLELPCKQ
jgi:hypothetical protein